MELDGYSALALFTPPNKTQFPPDSRMLMKLDRKSPAGSKKTFAEFLCFAVCSHEPADGGDDDDDGSDPDDV